MNFYLGDFQRIHPRETIYVVHTQINGRSINEIVIRHLSTRKFGFLYKYAMEKSYYFTNRNLQQELNIRQNTINNDIDYFVLQTNLKNRTTVCKNISYLMVKILILSAFYALFSFFYTIFYKDILQLPSLLVCLISLSVRTISIECVATTYMVSLIIGLTYLYLSGMMIFSIILNQSATMIVKNITTLNLTSAISGKVLVPSLEIVSRTRPSFSPNLVVLLVISALNAIVFFSICHNSRLIAKIMEISVHEDLFDDEIFFDARNSAKTLPVKKINAKPFNLLEYSKNKSFLFECDNHDNLGKNNVSNIYTEMSINSSKLVIPEYITICNGNFITNNENKKMPDSIGELLVKPNYNSISGAEKREHRKLSKLYKLKRNYSMFSNTLYKAWDDFRQCVFLKVRNEDGTLFVDGFNNSFSGPNSTSISDTAQNFNKSSICKYVEVSNQNTSINIENNHLTSDFAKYIKRERIKFLNVNLLNLSEIICDGSFFNNITKEIVSDTNSYLAKKNYISFKRIQIPLGSQINSLRLLMEDSFNKYEFLITENDEPRDSLSNTFNYLISTKQLANAGKDFQDRRVKCLKRLSASINGYINMKQRYKVYKILATTSGGRIMEKAVRKGFIDYFRKPENKG